MWFHQVALHLMQLTSEFYTYYVQDKCKPFKLINKEDRYWIYKIYESKDFILRVSPQIGSYEHENLYIGWFCENWAVTAQ